MNEKKQWVKTLKEFKTYKVGEVIEVDDAVATNWLDLGLAEQAADPTNDLFANFEKALEDREQRIIKTITESVKASKPSKIPAQPKDPDEKKSLGEFIKAVKDKRWDVVVNKYGSCPVEDGADGFVRKTATEGSISAGGALVPVDYENELLYVEGYDPFWKRCRIVPVNTNSVKFPILDQTGTPSGGSTAFAAGVVIGFGAEATAPGSGTQPAFKQGTWTNNKLIAYTQISNELLADSPISVDATLNGLFAEAHASILDYNVFAGSNSSEQFYGIVGHPATINQTRANAGTVGLVDFAKMYSKLLGSSRNRAVWVVHPSVMDALVTMEDTAGRVVFLPNMNAANALDMRVFGLPIFQSEHAGVLGSEADVMLIDPSKYLITLRADMAIFGSQDYAVTQDLYTVRTTMRCYGQPQLTAPITLADGSYQVSPFVTLSNAAS